MMLAVILGVVGTVILIGVLRAFVFTYLWAWFIVPLGAPHIGIAHAMGLAVIIGLLVDKPDLKERESSEAFARFGRAITHGVINIMMAWGLGFILHLIAA